MSETNGKEPVATFDGISERHGQRPPVYFMVLFFGLIVWGVIFMAYYLLSGWSSEAEFKDKLAAHQQQTAGKTAAATAATAATPTAARATGAAAAELFATHCAVCHGPAGKGGIGPDLTRSTYKYGRTTADIGTSISSGRANGMPPFGSQLSQAQISALTDFVLKL